jgi:hypothetical protein
MVFQLKNPKDEKIGVDHVRVRPKYDTHFQLNQVTKVFVLPFLTNL